MEDEVLARDIIIVRFENFLMEVFDKIRKSTFRSFEISVDHWQ